MARGGNPNSPTALEAPACSPEVELLWTVSTDFARRYKHLPAQGQTSRWMSEVLLEKKALSPAKVQVRLEVLRALANWPTFTQRPLASRTS